MPDQNCVAPAGALPFSSFPSVTASVANAPSLHAGLTCFRAYGTRLIVRDKRFEAPGFISMIPASRDRWQLITLIYTRSGSA